MASDLPKEFDVVVLGTGMPESIVAAAFSRIGQSVLHLDRNEFYSGDWSSFSLKAIEKWVESHQKDANQQGADKLCRPEVEEQSLLEEDETLVQLPLYNSSFSQVQARYFVREEEVENEATTTEQSTTPLESLGKAEVNGTCTDDKQTDQPDSYCTSSTTPSDQTVRSQSSSEQTNETIVKPTENKEELSPGANKINEVTEKVQGASLNDTADIDGGVNENKDKNEGVAKHTDTEAGKSDEAQSESTTLEIKPQPNVQQKQWTINKLKAEWRKFNIDISPKLLFSAGDMVELLISSDIAKYCEFKTITRILTILNGQMEVVPCSRAGVFSSKTLSMLEKRMLMKFLQFCADFENKQEELGDFLERPFVEFLESKKLSSTVRHYIQHSIAMATDTTTTQQGLCHMRKFLKSLGRYGNTAFLWSLYGSGELPQSFCRMCAVFGGVYCLRMSASSLILDKDNKCTGVITTEGQRIKCKYLIMENSYAPESFLSTGKQRCISRAVIMTDKPLLPTGQHELSQMCLPCPDDASRPVFLLELPPSSLSSPPGVYIFHLTRQGQEVSDPQEDLAYAVDLLFQKDEAVDDERPRVLWSLYFSHKDTSCIQPSDSLPSNVTLMSGPGMELDIDRTVTEARKVFQTILPEEEFLPKAPNPEDIVYVDDAETKVADDSAQSDLVESDKVADDSAQSDLVESDKVVDDSTQSNLVESDKVVDDSTQSDVVKSDKASEDGQTDTSEKQVCDNDGNDHSSTKPEAESVGGKSEDSRITSVASNTSEAEKGGS